MKAIVASIVLVLLLAARSSAQDALPGIVAEEGHDYHAKWAFVVGINYANSQAGLELVNAEKDATAIAQLLKDSYGFKCDVLLGERATRRAINSQLQAYENKVGANDCFLFYFAGHGITKAGMPHLYPADAESNDGAVSESLGAHEILGSPIRALHSLYIFDSCHAGEILNLRRFPPLDRAKDVQGEFKFESRSLQILMSSASNQKAKDGTDGHSPFARSLLDALVDLPRRDGTKVVGAAELAKYMLVQLKGQQAQFTHLNPDDKAHSGGNFLFTMVGAVPSRPLRTFLFQTLPGSYASLPGSPLEKTWFDEMPWLTPEMRLLLDGEYEKNPGQILSDTATAESDVAAQIETLNLTTIRLKELVRKELARKGPDGAHEKLLALSEAKDRVESVGNLLKAFSEITRGRQASPTELHLKALLRGASKNAHLPDDGSTIDDMFRSAVESYHSELQKGLRARCLADYANWLLREKNYQEAKNAFEQAISAIGDHQSPEMSLFRVELLAGVAIASRHLAKNSNDSRTARSLWRLAGEKYQEAFAAVSRQDAKIPDSHLVPAYLHERSAWLCMDLWEIDQAEQHFEQALAIRKDAGFDAETADLDAFLSICHAQQGLAMAKRLKGVCGKDELKAIQTMLETRITSEEVAAGREAAVERLWNTTERLGDCDFFRGESGMREALLVYLDRGLRGDIRRFEEHAKAEKVNEQRLRLCCKAIIAATLAGDERRFRDAKSMLKTTMLSGENKNTFLVLLHGMAQAFSEYNDFKHDQAQLSAAQEQLNTIRLLVRETAAPGLDRESAELLMMVAAVVSDEQRRLDANVLRAILPTGPDGKPPRGTVQYVRDQYDRIIMLQGGSDGSQVRGGPEFIDFVALVQGARQAENVSHEEPLAIFYFPRSGRNGLLLMQIGNNSDSGTVKILDFGWQDVAGLSQERIARVNEKLKGISPNARIYWSDDPLLQLPAICPFDVPGHLP